MRGVRFAAIRVTETRYESRRRGRRGLTELPELLRGFFAHLPAFVLQTRHERLHHKRGGLAMF